MSGSRSITSIDASEYELIEATMSESSRGRWFLQEYARRNRTADTEMLLGAIERLEGAVAAGRNAAPEPDRVDRMRVDLMDMANAIARTKVEIAAISAPDVDQSRLGIASLALDAIVHATERATTDILEAAEHVQEAAWILRESGTDGAVCDELDRMATQIYTACSFQDLTAQRTARIIHTLRYLEERLGVMMAIWGDELGDMNSASHGTSIPQEDLCQSDVDRFIDMEGLSGEVSKPKPPLPPAESLDHDLVFMVSPESPQDGGEAASDMTSATIGVPASGDDFLDEEQDEIGFAAADSEEWPGVDSGALPEAADLSQAPDLPVPDVMASKGDRDIALAFAAIDDLTPEQKMALFS